MIRRSRLFRYEFMKSQSVARRPPRWFLRSATALGIVSCCIIFSFLCPVPLLALGEYDGIWIGPLTVSIAGEQESETAGSVFYQEDSETLSLWDSLFGVVRLKKSGNEWVLPSPLQTTFWDIEATLTDFRLNFQSTSYMTGTATVDAEGYTGNATYTQYKQSCTVLTNGATLSGLSGAEESYQCYQIDIPAGVTNFNVQTSGGTGDCDLGVGYHRPDFSVQVSEGDFTQEQVQVSAPQSGLWYILLIGYTNFSGVNLSVSFQAVPAPIANFKADPVRGVAPLSVKFTDLSTGSVTGRTWSFGDGSESSDPSPTHIYAKPGVYTVSLTVTGPGGSKTETKNNYIEVKARKSMPWLPLLLED